MDVWFCIDRNLRREAQIALEDILIRSNARSPKRARKARAFRWTLTYMEVGYPSSCHYFWIARHSGRRRHEGLSLFNTFFAASSITAVTLAGSSRMDMWQVERIAVIAPIFSPGRCLHGRR
jgi:hypothetical protein